MIINVHLKGKLFKVNCDTGNQTIEWLSDVAYLLFEDTYHKLNSEIKIVQDEGNKMISKHNKINKTLTNNQNIWVILEDEC